MKPFKYFVFFLSILFLAGCWETFRGVLENEFESEAEVLTAVDAECDYWFIDAEACDELGGRLLELYRAKKELGLKFDSEVLRALFIRELFS